MSYHTQTRRKYKELALRFDRRGHDIQCSRLIVIGFLTILFAALTQSGCVGLTSAGNPFAKSSSSSTSANSIPSITTSPLSNAQLGIQFQESLTATGGVQPYVWCIASGKLPPGISLNAASGVLSGMASQGGQFDFSAQVSDSSSPTPQTAMKALTLYVLAFTLQISPGALPSGQVGVPFQTTLTGNGGVIPYTWTVAGALPSGLTLNASSGAITGTPKLAGTSTFTLNLTDSTGEIARMSSSITIAALGKGGKPVLSPATPVVNQGATLTFTCISNCGAGGTWSVSGTDSSGHPTTAAGSINSRTGVYTAPATVKAQQSYGGYQLLPNNHIFNTRIDSLPVNSHSAAWIARAGTVPFNYLVAIPNNFVDGSTPTQSMIFGSSPATDSVFQIPAYPGQRIQCGELISSADCDRHLWTIDTTDGMFQEIYDPVTPGTYARCPACNAASGMRYLNSQYGLPTAVGVITAAGNFMMPVYMKLQEMENAVATSGTINHALSITLQNGYICGSSTANACGGNAAGTRHIWPATSEAYRGGGIIPYGARFRLKSSFNISGYSAIAQILLKQLQQYGVILTDGGYGWQSGVEATSWPKAYLSAFAEVAYNGVSGIPTSDWEAVDESSLMVSSISGETTANREIVSYTSGTGTTTVDVVFQGVTVNMPKDALYIQAGTPAQQLVAYVHGGANNTVTWSMSSSIIGATLSSTGFFKPPTTLTTAASTTVTATSTDDTSISAMLTLWVFPTGSIQIRPGATSVYTDTTGKEWVNAGGDGGSISCCGNLSGQPWPSVPNVAEYYFMLYGHDIRYDFTVPNGTYQIRVKLGTLELPGGDFDTLEAQGTVYYSNIDVNVAAGGQYRPVDFVLSGVPVTNGQLSFVLRATHPNEATINALQITQTAN